MVVRMVAHHACAVNVPPTTSSLDCNEEISCTRAVHAPCTGSTADATAEAHTEFAANARSVPTSIGRNARSDLAKSATRISFHTSAAYRPCGAAQQCPCPSLTLHAGRNLILLAKGLTLPVLHISVATIADQLLVGTVCRHDVYTVAHKQADGFRATHSFSTESSPQWDSRQAFHPFDAKLLTESSPSNKT
ncbi:hypothetical protein BCR37DRAFT_117066 [Protomyces lactucae-debilis]|uniref:Uncharacterized protein n=1 Tax=Protomyces lactucae-debilis TaxID=2754530 RepID=A0A1Y2F2W1_PROLT|nr:uncharacterized protein BCR37DRAFT_117066 [Protomyces lactucae-debilis]ORY78230.1 hypothetical protein BCR37DRAFT_117066 [Protomyces lactucae-debilis]